MKGGGRVAAALLADDLRHHERLLAQLLDEGRGDLRAPQLRLLAVDADELAAELRRQRRLEVCLDAPVLDRDELPDLLLALHHQAHGHALHAARGEAAADLLPEDGRDPVADQPVENAARLLRVIEIAVELQRRLDGLLDGLLGDLVEEDARGGHLALLELLEDVPGDGLALAVGVGGEEDAVDALGRRLELGDHLLLRLDDLVDRLEPVLDVHADLALGQVHHVAHRGLHHVARAQVLLDRLRLGGRLHHHQRGALRAGGSVGLAARLLAGGLAGLRRLRRRCRLAGCHHVPRGGGGCRHSQMGSKAQRRRKNFPGLCTTIPFNSSSASLRSACVAAICDLWARSST